MAACPVINLGIPKPANSLAAPDVDLAAIITARSTMAYFGDETTLASTAGKVASWPSRFGGIVYSSTADIRQPIYVPDGGPAGGPCALFVSDGTANADRLATNESIKPADFPRTIIDLVKWDGTGPDFLFGTTASPDSISCSLLAGQAQLRYGDAYAAVPMPVDEWVAVVSSWTTSAGLPRCEVQVLGVAAQSSATTAPTTARNIHMGATSGLSNLNTFGGSWALRIMNNAWIGADRAFHHDVIGRYLSQVYGIVNPVASI